MTNETDGQTRPSRRIAIHPVVVAAVPVLYLWSQNVTEVGFVADVLAPMLVTVGATAAGYAVLTALFRDHRRAALVASAATVLFLTFGYATGGLETAWHAPLLGVWVAAAVVVALAVRRLKGVSEATGFANGLAVILLLVAAAPGVAHAARGTSVEAAERADAGAAVDGEHPGASPGPGQRDIYYIILDRYARADTLEEEYGYDNSDFLGFLEERGFTVSDDSLTNYPKTAHALAAALNMRYLDDLAAVHGTAGNDWAPVYRMLRDHAVGHFLKARGYRYVHVGSWFDALADSELADVVHRYSSDSEFGVVYEQTTAWPVIRRLLGGDQPTDVRSVRRDATLFQLDTLDELASRPRGGQPRFVYAPVTLPHGPYALDAEGRFQSKAEERARTREQNYLGQLRYANRRVGDLVDRLLDGPDETDPIIVIQSDEGPNPDRMEDYPAGIRQFPWTLATTDELQRKLRILNAYHLPGLHDSPVYPGITPVNTFRVVFDAYFDTNFGRLPDRAYVFRNEDDLYDFTDVTARVREEGPAGEP